MSKGHKLMLGVGAALIVGMLLVAAFSLGVYVGEHGWTWQGVSLAGPQPRPRPGAAPPPPPNLPGLGQPDLVGRVRGIEEGRLSLATPDGPRVVETTGQTRVRTVEGGERSLDALQPGDLVAVFGHRSDGGQTLVADVVVLLPRR
ncbi:MAG TPA: hypothetical protein ENK08_04995 [Chloroflexi bacterium]|nr:hypothetical protein [Chloroflexota bacterium]